jgi:hypothetical protein
VLHAELHRAPDAVDAVVAVPGREAAERLEDVLVLLANQVVGPGGLKVVVLAAIGGGLHRARSELDPEEYQRGSRLTGDPACGTLERWRTNWPGAERA